MKERERGYIGNTKIEDTSIYVKNLPLLCLQLISIYPKRHGKLYRNLFPLHHMSQIHVAVQVVRNNASLHWTGYFVEQLSPLLNLFKNFKCLYNSKSLLQSMMVLSPTKYLFCIIYGRLKLSPA